MLEEAAEVAMRLVHRLPDAALSLIVHRLVRSRAHVHKGVRALQRPLAAERALLREGRSLEALRAREELFARLRLGRTLASVALRQRLA